MYSQNQIESLKKNGFLIFRKFLNNSELHSVTKKISFFSVNKGHKNAYYACNFKSKLIKLLKFQFSQFFTSQLLIRFSKNKNMKELADIIFGKQSFLKMIDSYYSPIDNKEVLPWHVDQAYSGKLDVKDDELVNPDGYSIKFFIYLTKVGPNNGCTSYIPESNKITYAIRKGLKEKKIKYSPHWLLKDLRNFIKKKENLDYLNNYFNSNTIIKKFLKETDFIEKNIDNKKFDFEMSPGDAIIFDEGGVHKGSKILFNDRRVLRYHYSIKV